MTDPVAHPVWPVAPDRLLEQRIVILGEAVDEQSANRIVSQLLLLSIEDPKTDICLCINSPGGSVLAGLAIYDTIQLIPNDVSTVAFGLAASMGQILLCAGTPGKRFALPNVQVVMHEGSAGLGGSAADVEIQAANLLDTLARMRRIIARHTGNSIEQVEADVGRDRWFNAKQALEYGFIDHIATAIHDFVPVRASRNVGPGGAGR